MPRIDVSFIVIGVLFLIAGMLLGITMGATHDFQYVPVHSHINLLGWASLALFGLIYRAYPALSNSWLAKAHFIVSVLGSILLPLGIFVAVTYENPILAIIASFVALIGVIIFLCNLLRVFAFAPKTTASRDF